jgi:hypothetical protein
MPIIYTEIKINAPRAKVWQTLWHKERWMYWNTFLYDCSPKQALIPGQKVALSVRRNPGAEELEFLALVTQVAPHYSLKWITQIPGFRHEHGFELQDVGGDRTQYIHQGHFSGLLCPLIFPFIRRAEQRGINRMAQELKAYVEQN